eukprot:symbB.v1.2.023125.t1/scaffold2096.1/size89696/4
MHGSCKTETSEDPKIFMAKFIRGSSLLGTYDSLRTPELPAEMRAWMDAQQVKSGLDAAVLWTLETDYGVLDPSDCGAAKHPWFIRPSEVSGISPELVCKAPRKNEFQKRQPGEVFEMHFLVGNTGSRPWPPETVLSLRDGDPMGGPVGVKIPEVPPGNTVRLSLRLEAPPNGKAFLVDWVEVFQEYVEL